MKNTDLSKYLFNLVSLKRFLYIGLYLNAVATLPQLCLIFFYANSSFLVN